MPGIDTCWVSSGEFSELKKCPYWEHLPEKKRTIDQDGQQPNINSHLPEIKHYAK